MSYRLKGIIFAAAMTATFSSIAADSRLADTHRTLAEKLELTPGQIQKVELLKAEAEKNWRVPASGNLISVPLLMPLKPVGGMIMR